MLDYLEKIGKIKQMQNKSLNQSFLLPLPSSVWGRGHGRTPDRFVLLGLWTQLTSEARLWLRTCAQVDGTGCGPVHLCARCRALHREHKTGTPEKDSRSFQLCVLGNRWEGSEMPNSGCPLTSWFCCVIPEVVYKCWSDSSQMPLDTFMSIVYAAFCGSEFHKFAFH